MIDPLSDEILQDLRALDDSSISDLYVELGRMEEQDGRARWKSKKKEAAQPKSRKHGSGTSE